MNGHTATSAPGAGDVPVRPRAEVQRAGAMTVALACALTLLGLAWELWLAPTGRGTLALKVLPLVLALPGLVRHRLYTYRWLGLVVWLYALEGLVRGTSDSGAARALAWVEVALALALFGATAIYIRRRFARDAA